MKKLISIVILAALIPGRIMAYEIIKTSNGDNVHWSTGQIDIYLDTSLDGDESVIFEESFLTWLDYIDSEITLNFIYDECNPYDSNCMYNTAGDTRCNSPACTTPAWYRETGFMAHASIAINKDLHSDDKTNAIMHEVGHFFGMNHSDNHKSIMYKYITSAETLHEDDIAGIMTAYSADGTIYPAPEIEPIDYSFQGCSITNPTTTYSLWSLIF